jgi:flagellar FliL protein
MKEEFLMASRDEQQNQDKSRTQSNNKMLIIIVIVAVVVCVTAVSAVFLLRGGAKGAAAKEDKTEKSESVIMFSQDPFIVNIYDGQDLRYMKLRLDLELASIDAKNELTARQSQLRDAVLAILTTKTLQDVQNLQGKNQLKVEILAALSKIVAPGKVKQIYFTDFVVQ